jgi:mannose-6-phosphate isomerase-like protein (cupin superfamily)
METGVVWEQLGRNTKDGLEFMLVTYPPGARSSDSGRYQCHDGLECAFIIRGRLTCKVTFEEIELGPGDSITFDSSRPHLLQNFGTEEVSAVWVIVHRPTAEVLDRLQAHLPAQLMPGQA